MQVAVRMRPVIPPIDGEEGEVLGFDEGTHKVQVAVDVHLSRQLKSFGFDALFGPNRTTDEMYEELVAPSVSRLRLGYNMALFAYGQTGAGKTFTMMGDPDRRVPGVTTLAFKQMFEEQARSPDQVSTVRVSVMEIYQDVVYDLLNECGKVQLKGSGGGGGVMRFDGLVEHRVRSAEEATRIVNRGLEERTQAATYVHEHSNRSHTIVRVLQETWAEGEGVLLASLLLVDLAGSETVELQTGQQKEEGKCINSSVKTSNNVKQPAPQLIT